MSSSSFIVDILQLNTLKLSASIMIAGSVSAALYYIVKFILDWIWNLFYLSVTIENTGENAELFKWILRWFDDYQQKQNKLNNNALTYKRFTIHMKKRNENKIWNEDENENNSRNENDFEFLPGQGKHTIVFEGKKIYMTRWSTDKVVTIGWDNTPLVQEKISLSCFTRDYKIFEKLFRKARELSLEVDNDKVKIYSLDDHCHYWQVMQTKEPRDMDSVILDTDLAEKILEDCREFLKSEEWYIEKGIPWKRGYLLYGPPGNGKTSYVKAVSSALKMNICVLNLSNNSLNDQTLISKLNDTPSNSIILLEDIDAVFVDRNTTQEHHSSVTFSGLLNALDGVASPEGRIFFFSTNHIEKLDPALIRPGRADLKLEFKNASKYQMKMMFLRFYPGQDELAEEFSSKIPEFTVSMSALQEHFIERKKPHDAIKEYISLLKIGERNLIEGNEIISQSTLINDEIAIWLRRLALSKYTELFWKEEVHSITDLKGLQAHTLASFNITKTGEVQRIIGMLQGRSDIVADFEYASTKLIYEKLESKYKNDENFVQMANQFIETIEKSNIPGVSIHQIKAHVNNYSDMKTALAEINELVNPSISLIPSNLDEIYNPNRSIKDVIEADAELKGLINIDLFVKEEIDTIDEFLELSQTEIETIGKIQKQGDKIILKKKIESLKSEKQKRQKFEQSNNDSSNMIDL